VECRLLVAECQAAVAECQAAVADKLLLIPAPTVVIILRRASNSLLISRILRKNPQQKKQRPKNLKTRRLCKCNKLISDQKNKKLFAWLISW
jgi:hypothetical protein